MWIRSTNQITPVDPTAIPWKIIMGMFIIEHAALGMVFTGMDDWKLFLAFKRSFDIGFMSGIIREHFLCKFPAIPKPLVGDLVLLLILILCYLEIQKKYHSHSLLVSVNMN